MRRGILLSGGTQAAVALAAACGLAGCSMIRTSAIKNVGNTLAAPGDTFTSDNDPELVRRAVPFALKMYETLLVSIPTHTPLLVATCSGYTSYAYAFVETDADLLREEQHHEEIKALRDEAVTLYLRGKDYCLARHGREVPRPDQGAAGRPGAGAQEGHEQRGRAAALLDGGVVERRHVAAQGSRPRHRFSGGQSARGTWPRAG